MVRLGYICTYYTTGHPHVIDDHLYIYIYIYICIDKNWVKPSSKYIWLKRMTYLANKISFFIFSYDLILYTWLNLGQLLHKLDDASYTPLWVDFCVI